LLLVSEQLQWFRNGNLVCSSTTSQIRNLSSSLNTASTALLHASTSWPRTSILSDDASSTTGVPITPFVWSSGSTIQFAAQITYWFPNPGILTRPQKMIHHGTRVRFAQNHRVLDISPDARISGTLNLG
jgi:hypothetical protein